MVYKPTNRTGGHHLVCFWPHRSRLLVRAATEDYTAFLDKVRIDGQLCLFKERFRREFRRASASLGNFPERMRILTGYTPCWSRVSGWRGLLLTFIMLLSFTDSITTDIPSWPCYVRRFLPWMVKSLRIDYENLHRTPRYLEWTTIWFALTFLQINPLIPLKVADFTYFPKRIPHLEWFLRSPIQGPVIKHGVLENEPFSLVIFLARNRHL